MTTTGAHTTLYQDASLYDILHTPGTAWEVTGLERTFELHVPEAQRAGPWLEPACGTGRYLRLLGGRGRACIGFDAMPSMTAYARTRLERLGLDESVRIIDADMTGFIDSMPADAPGRVPFAFNLINTFRHLHRDADAHRHLGAMSRVLKPGGVYAVGSSTTAFGIEQPSEDTWSATRGTTRVTQTVQYLPAEARDRVETVISHLVAERPGGAQDFDDTYTLRAYTAEQWADLVAASPLELQAIVDEQGNETDAPMVGYAVYLLRNPG